MPNQARHEFRYLALLGVHHYLYQPPNSTTPFVVEYDTLGLPVLVNFPSGQRRVTYRYDSVGLPTAIFFDTTDVVFDYYSSSRMIRLATVSVISPARHSVSLVYENSDALVSKHSVTFNETDTLLVRAEFRYTYDSYFRCESLSAVVGGQTLHVVRSNYSGETGRLEATTPFIFQTTRLNREITRDANVEIIREFDRYGQLTDVSYSFNNYIVFSVEVNHDALGRVHQWRRQVGSSDLKAYEYVYDIDGNIVEVLVNGHSTWKYTFDANDNIVRVRDGLLIN